MQIKEYDDKLIKSRGELVYNEYLKLIESGELLLEIEVVLEKLKMNLTKFVSILMQYLKQHETNDDYTFIFETLLNCEDPKAYLRENNIPADLLSSNLNNYLYYKRPDILFGNKILLRTLNSLIEYNNKLNKVREEEKNNKENFLPFIESIVKDFLKQKNWQWYYFNPKSGLYIRKLSLYNKELYQEFLTDYTIREENKETTITNDIYNILSTIKEQGFIDAIDFYQTTIYSSFEILEVANKILDVDDNKLIRKYLNRLGNSFITNNRNNNLKIELLREKYTFNLDGTLIETSKDERLIILDFLEKENIPISSVAVFQDACRKYYKNELIPKRSKKYD